MSFAQNTATSSSDSLKWTVWSLSVNSPTSDFSPVYYKKGIVFASERPHETGVIYYDPETKSNLLALFYATRKDSFSFHHPHLFAGSLSTIYNDGPACFNQQQTVVYFTSNDRSSKRKNHPNNKLMIYTSSLSGNKWGKPEAVNLQTNGYSCGHPALSPDGKTLYFVSNMPGGYGGTDIYSSKLENGNWSTPVNLGSEINTKGNEEFPFMSADGVLYFASDGHNGMGGLDIYSAVDEKGFGYIVTHLPAPFNSSADDFGYACDSTDVAGYFSSNRNATDTANDDIYGFRLARPVFDHCDTIKTTYCYRFFDQNTLDNEDTTGFSYEWDFGDSTRKRGLEVTHCYHHTGTFLVQLNVVDRSTGVVFFNQTSYQLNVEPRNQLLFDAPDTVAAGNTITVDASHTEKKGFTINQYYWSFGDGTFATGKKAKHSFQKPGEYKVQLGIIVTNKMMKKLQKFGVVKKITVINN